jgi:hypothetical protein
MMTLAVRAKAAGCVAVLAVAMACGASRERDPVGGPGGSSTGPSAGTGGGTSGSSGSGGTDTSTSGSGGAASTTAAIETLLEDGGGRVDWLVNADIIAYDARGADGCYDVLLMDPLGGPICADAGCTSNCLTCQNEALTAGTVGQPAWHPSGKYLVVQVEKASHPGDRCSVGTNPGAGAYSDLWFVDATTAEAALAVEVPLSLDCAVLHPHFSRDGTMLSWAQMVERPSLFVPGKEFGLWELRVADVDETAGLPTLTNVRSFTPNGPRWYENHGFSPIGARLIFTSSEDGLAVPKTANIYTLDLADGDVQKLTTAGYNEHGQFSPDGAFVVWMSGADVFESTDYWIMNADGSDKRRISFFNDPSSPDYQGQETIAADFSFGASSSTFVAYAHGAFIPVFERIFRVELSR